MRKSWSLIIFNVILDRYIHLKQCCSENQSNHSDTGTGGTGIIDWFDTPVPQKCQSSQSKTKLRLYCQCNNFSTWAWRWWLVQFEARFLLVTDSQPINPVDSDSPGHTACRGVLSFPCVFACTPTGHEPTLLHTQLSPIKPILFYLFNKYVLFI